MNEPTIVTIAPSGTKVSPELQTYISIVETDDQSLVDALSAMKVAPPDTIFMMTSQRAVFLVNNAAEFDMSFRIFHPKEDDLDTFNAAWLGLEKFNSYIKEEELQVKYIAATKAEDDERDTRRFGHQYARLNKDKEPVVIKKPSYAREADVDDEDAETE